MEDIINPVNLNRYTSDGNGLIDYDQIATQSKPVYSFQSSFGSKIEQSEVKNSRMKTKMDSVIKNNHYFNEVSKKMCQLT